MRNSTPLPGKSYFANLRDSRAVPHFDQPKQEQIVSQVALCFVRSPFWLKLRSACPRPLSEKARLASPS